MKCIPADRPDSKRRSCLPSVSETAATGSSRRAPILHSGLLCRPHKQSERIFPLCLRQLRHVGIRFNRISARKAYDQTAVLTARRFPAGRKLLLTPTQHPGEPHNRAIERNDNPTTGNWGRPPRLHRKWIVDGIRDAGHWGSPAVLPQSPALAQGRDESSIDEVI